MFLQQTMSHIVNFPVCLIMTLHISVAIETPSGKSHYVMLWDENELQMTMWSTKITTGKNIARV